MPHAWWTGNAVARWRSAQGGRRSLWCRGCTPIPRSPFWSVTALGACALVRPWRIRQEASAPALPPAPLARLIRQPAGRLTETARDPLQGVREATPLLARGYRLKTRVQTRLAEWHVGAFEPWLQPAEPSALPSFQPVARSCRQDTAALLAALTPPWRTGLDEGPSCRMTRLTRLS
jgi:hypothetical protein